MTGKTQDEKPEKEASEQTSDDGAELNSLNGAGDARLRVEAKVSIFDLNVGQVGYLSRTPEVEKAIEAGLLVTQ